MCVKHWGFSQTFGRLMISIMVKAVQISLLTQRCAAQRSLQWEAAQPAGDVALFSFFCGSNHPERCVCVKHCVQGHSLFFFFLLRKLPRNRQHHVQTFQKNFRSGGPWFGIFFFFSTLAVRSPVQYCRHERAHAHTHTHISTMSECKD